MAQREPQVFRGFEAAEFEDAWSSRVQAELDGLPVCFLRWQSLIENKQASGRPKDLADVAKLKAVAAARRPPG